MRAVLVLALLVLTIAAPAGARAGACADPRALAQDLGERGFVQTRRLAGLDQPIVSSGRVTVREDEIVWAVLDPFEVVTRISGTGMTQAIEGGPEEPLDAGGASNVLLSESGLLDLLRGDLSRVDARYRVAEAATPTGWLLILEPVAEDMARHIDHIDVSGCARIGRLAVSQSNGDTITVVFTD